MTVVGDRASARSEIEIGSPAALVVHLFARAHAHHRRAHDILTADRFGQVNSAFVVVCF